MKPKTKVVKSLCGQPSLDLPGGTLDCSTQPAQPSGDRTKGSSRCSRKPLRGDWRVVGSEVRTLVFVVGC